MARDGIDGLWRATEFDFDMVVLDIMLPGLNGFVVADRSANLAAGADSDADRNGRRA